MTTFYKKPHIRLVSARQVFPGSLTEGFVWCLFSTRTSRRPIAISRDREKVFRVALQKFTKARSKDSAFNGYGWYRSYGHYQDADGKAPARHGVRWNEKEIADLENEVAARWSVKMMANAHQRKESSVLQQLEYLGYRDHAPS